MRQYTKNYWISEIMKILHIFAELKPSGGEAMMLSAAPMWLAKSEMHILSTGDVVGVYAEKLAAVGYTIHHISFKKSFSFFINVINLIKKENYDIVHLHTERASLWFSLSARIALGYESVLIRTVHHIFKFNGWLRFRKFVERRLMRSLFKVNLISNSPSGKRNEMHRFNSNNVLIPNWYDSNFYLPPSVLERMNARNLLNYQDDVCVFLSLGGNWEYKNYYMIVEALALLPADINVLYVQVGVQGEGAPLETLAKKLGVRDRLKCMGVVDDPKLYLHAADVYMMPSSEEGFGVAAVEAMACGLPSILSNVEALCDFEKYVPGIKYIKPNPREIADAMINMTLLPEVSRRNLGLSIAMSTRENYGLESGACGYLDLYKKLHIN